ncbi:MAG: cation diffusion facilitator family transporter [Holosporaceae bacterium]|jgi:ferrous-iron efflux pump FieF|nr:cation diffusion facilitator family transporter [Holosporaceae bacterium]
MFLKVKLLDNALDFCFKDVPHTELAKKSIALGIITSFFLMIIKFGAWMVTSSISIRASMNDSILDALTSFLAYKAMACSSMPVDKKHNFGHEKMEAIAALFQCLLVIYSGIMIFVEAYEVFQNSREVVNTKVGIVVMIISCLAVYQLVYFQNYVTKKTESILVKGDSLHYLSDFLMNGIILVSLLTANFFHWGDAVGGIIVGGYVLYSAILILKSAIIDLMDESLPSKVQDDIKEAIESVRGVEKVKILKTRSAGMKKYVESRIQVNSNILLTEAHRITEEAEGKIKKMFEKVDVIIKAEIE